MKTIKNYFSNSLLIHSIIQKKLRISKMVRYSMHGGASVGTGWRGLMLVQFYSFEVWRFGVYTQSFSGSPMRGRVAWLGIDSGFGFWRPEREDEGKVISDSIRFEFLEFAISKWNELFIFDMKIKLIKKKKLIIYFKNFKFNYLIIRFYNKIIIRKFFNIWTSHFVSHLKKRLINTKLTSSACGYLNARKIARVWEEIKSLVKNHAQYNYNLIKRHFHKLSEYIKYRKCKKFKFCVFLDLHRSVERRRTVESVISIYQERKMKLLEIAKEESIANSSLLAKVVLAWRSATPKYTNQFSKRE